VKAQLIGGLGGVNAQDDYAQTDENVPVAINVLANDQSIPGDSLHVQSVTQPSGGTATVNPDNTVTYSPSLDYFGSDSFQYTAADQTGLMTGTATVHVTVNAVSTTTTSTITTTVTSSTTTISSTTTTSTATSTTSTVTSTTTSTTSVVGGITVYAHRIPATYWDPCFATSCTNPQDPCNTSCTGPGASMYFALLDSNGNLVQDGYADENGYTFTGLNPSVTYYVYPADCDSCHGSTHDVVFDHWGDGSNVRPLAATVGSSLDAWYSCTNGCGDGP